MKSGLLNTLKNNKLLFLFSFIVFLNGCEQQSPAQMPASPPPPTVTVAQPLVKDVTDWDEFTGRLYAVESVEVRPRVSGYLESIHFTEGSIVNKGDLLYVIDPRPYKAILEQAKADLRRAQAALDLAENDMTRAERLYKSHTISEEEMDARSHQKREAIASLEAARAAVKSAELDLNFTHIKSPISGRISRTMITQGNLVTGGNTDSTLLTTIVSLDPIYVYFTADEQSVLHYTRMDMAGTRKSSRKEPNPVKLRLADEEDFQHEGHMDFVDNQIDLATGTLRARAVVNNPDYILVPGMFADVRLLGEGPYETLLIPDSAINIDQTNRFVYVIDENNAVSRKQIKTGNMHDGLRSIRSGINKEDKIIIKGIQRVRAGMQVTPEFTSLEITATQKG